MGEGVSSVLILTADLWVDGGGGLGVMLGSERWPEQGPVAGFGRNLRRRPLRWPGR